MKPPKKPWHHDLPDSRRWEIEDDLDKIEDKIETNDKDSIVSFRSIMTFLRWIIRIRKDN